MWICHWAANENRIEALAKQGNTKEQQSNTTENHWKAQENQGQRRYEHMGKSKRIFELMFQ